LDFVKIFGRLRSERSAFIEHQNCISELLEHEAVKTMDMFRHHKETSCLDHCQRVSYYSYKVCRFFGLDYVSAARGGLLHDLFLYDWRTTKRDEGLHAFVHADIALTNALEHFHLNDREKDIIQKHMWPVTLERPKFMESFIVSIMDKYCAFVELF